MSEDITRHSEKLYYFYQITRYGSLHAAGRSLRISPPTLSYSISELERILNVKLFNRSSKGMDLTSEGDKLKIFCQRFFEELSSISQNLSNPEFTPKRKIKIGIFPSIAIYFWPLVYEYLGQNDDLLISLNTNRSQVLLESLVKKEIDVAITVDSIKEGSIIKQLLYEDHYAFYVSKSKNIQRESFKNEVLFYMPEARDQEGKNLRQYLTGSNLKFNNEFELDSLEVTKEFVLRGYGIGILPTQVAKAFKSEIKLIRPSIDLPSEFGPHSFYFSYRNDLDLAEKVIQNMISAAKKAVKKMNEISL